MTDATNTWTGGDAARQEDDPTKPAPRTNTLVADGGERTPPAAVAASGSERRTFDEKAEAPQSAKREAIPPSPGLSNTEQESLLRASLETIRVKAEELRGQAKDWAQISGEQARQAIDERPITAVAAAFGAGLVVGALLSR